MKLYDIAEEYRQQLDRLAELDLDPQTVADTIDGLQGDLQDKLRAIIGYSLELDIAATGAADAAKRMQDRAKTLDARVASLRAYALQAMQATGLPGLETDEWTAKPAKRPPSVEITDAAALPPAFVRQPKTPSPAADKAAIAAALQSGAEVPGARLVHGWRLAIK
jgi:hypothetical protein